MPDRGPERARRARGDTAFEMTGHAGPWIRSRGGAAAAARAGISAAPARAGILPTLLTSTTLALLVPLGAPAQDDDDLLLPPRIDEAPRPEGGGPSASSAHERPGAARLAEPPPRAREALEEVVVVGEQRWRLPDLGSEWHEREREEQGDARIQVRFFEVYDPDDTMSAADPFPLEVETSRVGFIELFRIRFGAR